MLEPDEVADRRRNIWRHTARTILSNEVLLRTACLLTVSYKSYTTPSYPNNMLHLMPGYISTKQIIRTSTLGGWGVSSMKLSDMPTLAETFKVNTNHPVITINTTCGPHSPVRIVEVPHLVEA